MVLFFFFFSSFCFVYVCGCAFFSFLFFFVLYLRYMNERETERERGGGGERERNCIVMDGYMLMNLKINKIYPSSPTSIRPSHISLTVSLDVKHHATEEGRLGYSRTFPLLKSRYIFQCVVNWSRTIPNCRCDSVCACVCVFCLLCLWV